MNHSQTATVLHIHRGFKPISQIEAEALEYTREHNQLIELIRKATSQAEVDMYCSRLKHLRLPSPYVSELT